MILVDTVQPFLGSGSYSIMLLLVSTWRSRKNVATLIYVNKRIPADQTESIKKLSGISDEV